MGSNNKRKTTEQFKQEVFNLVGNEYLVKGKYVNAKTKIRFVHNIEGCMHEFDMQPSNFLSGQRCPNCRYKTISSKQRKTQDVFEKEVFDLVGNEYTVVGNYVNSFTKIDLLHNKCGCIYNVKPSEFLSGSRCNNNLCLHDRLSEAMRDDMKTFIDKFEKRSKGEYILLSDYTLSCNKIKIKHKCCGHIFEMKANNFINGQGCPSCQISKGELKIKNFLQYNKIKFIPQKSFDKLIGVGGGNLSYDFYIPSYNLLIEYQGEYHDGSVSLQTEDKFNIQQEHDRRKREYAKYHSIDLLEIWYWDFENIENILGSYLNLYTEKQAG